MDTEYSLKSWRESKELVLITVTIALFADLVFVSAAVPVILRYFVDFEPSSQIQNIAPNTTLLSQIKTSYENVTHGTGNFKGQTNSTLDSTPYTNDGTHTPSNPIQINSTNSRSRNEEYLQAQILRTSILIGSKSFVQLIVNPIVGPLTQRFGYGKPMLFGFIIQLFSILLFTFGKTYEVLLLARAFQGLGSACTLIAGMSGLAARYTMQDERDNSIRIAIGAASLGVMVGPPFASFMYEFFEKKLFLFISGLTIIYGVLQISLKEPHRSEQEKKLKPPSMWELLSDPYIVVAAAGMFLTCAAFALFEACLYLWIEETMHVTRRESEMVLIPIVVGFIIVMNIIGRWCLKMGRWLLAMLGMMVATVCLFLIPLTKSITQLIVPNLILGLGIGMVHTALMPEFAYLVDIRHTPMYGNVYAIDDFSQCLGQVIGPIGGSFILKHLGFTWMMHGLAIVSLIYIPMIYVLRNPPRKNKKMQRVEAKSLVHLIQNGHVERRKSIFDVIPKLQDGVVPQ